MFRPRPECGRTPTGPVRSASFSILGIPGLGGKSLSTRRSTRARQRSSGAAFSAEDLIAGWRFLRGCSIGFPARAGASQLLRTSALLRLAPWRHFSETQEIHRNLRRSAQHWAHTMGIGEMSMPRKPTTCQFNLFSNPDDAETTQTPQWQALPAETRRSVTKLMVTLILDHVDDVHSPGEREVRHDA